MRLLVCSNSAPRWQDGPDLRPHAPGGLVPRIIALLRQSGGHWVFTAPPGVAGGGPATSAGGGVFLHPLRVPEPVARQHYEQVSVRLLLWLFHYLLDTSEQPVFDAGAAGAWAGYEAVNDSFAARLMELSEDSPDELILVNDHHLMLVPARLAAARPRRASRLAYFHTVPWCEPDYFGILPPRVRTLILESLLLCDVVGFHARRWASAFIACCARFLETADVTDQAIAYRGRQTAVVVAPGPLDVQALDRISAEQATERWQDDLGRVAQGRRMVVRAERLDLWKNLPRGFAAYEALLERRPRLAGDWWFCAVASLPTRMSDRHRAYQERCEAAVRRINDRFGSAGRPAATLVYPGLRDGSRNCVAAALAMSAVTLVNPTFDGLNLVAKEALLLRGGSPLLLSVNAGVHEQLAPYVTDVHPFDVELTRDALAAAIDSAPDPGGGRSAACRDLLLAESALAWLDTLHRGLPR